MLYAMFGALGLSIFAAIWMAKLLGDAGAYKAAFTIMLFATLGWCMPVFLQVFLLAGFVTIGVQYWEEVKAPFVAWIMTAGAVVAIGYSTGTEDLVEELNSQRQADVPAETAPVGTTP